jgi:hypothetical protein
VSAALLFGVRDGALVLRRVDITHDFAEERETTMNDVAMKHEVDAATKLLTSGAKQRRRSMWNMLKGHAQAIALSSDGMQRSTAVIVEEATFDHAQLETELVRARIALEVSEEKRARAEEKLRNRKR